MLWTEKGGGGVKLNNGKGIKRKKGGKETVNTEVAGRVEWSFTLDGKRYLPVF